MNWKFWKKSEAPCNHTWFPLFKTDVIIQENEFSYCPLCDTLRIGNDKNAIYYGKDNDFRKRPMVQEIIDMEMEKMSYTSNW
jgi:hypothetical protein